MTFVRDVYTQYRINQGLQIHQLRVAAVAWQICNAMRMQVARDEVVAACLFHDMGNILKFNLDLYSQLLEPEGKIYWQKIKDEFRAKYGSDEHVATREITVELLHALPFVDETAHHDSSLLSLLVSEHGVLQYLDAIGFSHTKENAESDDFGKKIAAYADMRVSPHGITTMQSRLEDGHARFNTRHHDLHKDHFAMMAGFLSKIESQIFSRCSIAADDITEEGSSIIISHLASASIQRFV